MISCFHVAFMYFLKKICAVRVDIKQGRGQISNVESTYWARVHNEFRWLPQSNNSLWIIFQNFP